MSSLGKFAGPLGSLIGTAASTLLSAAGKLFGIQSKAEKQAESLRRQEEAWNRAIAHTQNLLEGLGHISDETAKRLNEMSRSMQGYIAVDKLFVQIIKEVGVNQENINTLWQRATDILGHVASGQIKASEAADILNDAFEELLEGARELGQEGSEAMLDFILAAREAGIEIASVTKYVFSELDKIPNALTTMVGNIRKIEFIDQTTIDRISRRFKEITKGGETASQALHDVVLHNVDRIKELLGEKLTGIFEKWAKTNNKSWYDILEWIDEYNLKIEDLIPRITKQLNRMAEVTKVSFEAMIAEGRGWMETFYAMQEPLQLLRERYEALGIDVPEFLKPLFELSEKIQLKPAVFENLDAAQTILKSLSNTGYLTQLSFDALSAAATRFARVIIGDVVGGLNNYLETADLTTDKINQLLPVIAQFVGTAALFGLEIPAWMKTFIRTQTDISWQDFKNQSRAQANAGIATVDKLQQLIDVSRGLDSATRSSIQNMSERLAGLLRDIRNALGYRGREENTNLTGGGITPQSFQNEGYIPSPTLAMVHGGEIVADVRKLQAGVSKFSGMFGGSGQSNFNFYISTLDGADVERVVTQRIMPILNRAYRDNIGGSTRDLSAQIRKY